MVKPMGLGYQIIECEGIDLNLPENQKILSEIVSPAWKIRGQIISISHDVDFILDEIIGLFFIKDNPELTNIFKKSILEKEFFTLAEKMNVLNYLLTNHSEKFHLKSEKDRKQIITAIREIMEYRNVFAHQEIIVNFKDRKALILNKNGENQLSPAHFKKFGTNVGYLTLAHLALFTNLAIEISKESQNNVSQ